MKQILQNLRTGTTDLAEIPCPQVTPGHVLIRTTTTLISVGTERMLVSFGQASLLGKAKAQPDRVRQVLDKIRTDGLLPTIEAVFNKLDQPLPLGYCNVGIVLEVGEGVSGLAVGDRVASNGRHAQVVNVPRNLCARIPDGVSDEAAAFTVIGAIGLEGIRLLQPTLGETVVVTGLGLVGLVTAQLLRANGCRVLGIDLDPAKLALGRAIGIEVVELRTQDPVQAATAFSRGRGVDGVVITASTSSSEPVHQAAEMCRKRGRIVLVGVTGLELSRANFYEKELSFQVSCSYGPGRYDPSYEDRGVDYPVGFVRWTEQRNFEAVLDMLADRRIAPEPFISHRFPIADAGQAYQLIAQGEDALGVLLAYPSRIEQPDVSLRAATVPTSAPGAGTRSIGFIGSGNYAGAVLVPAFKAAGARLKVIASSGGVSSVHVARKYGVESTTTDVASVLGDSDVEAVVIATRHDSHARLVVEGLDAGKHVFVEKPLALTGPEIDAIEAAHERHPDRILMVGFNRRFAPHVRQMASLLSTLTEPVALVATVNAGALPPNHWSVDPAQGGRIVGEACHFIDLLRHLAGAPIVDFTATAIPSGRDTATIGLRFQNGTIGTIHYFTNGHKSFPKERIEVFCSGRILRLDNFRRLDGFGWPAFRGSRLWRQDKGQRACTSAFVRACQDGVAPIPVAQLFEVARATLAIARAAR